MQNYAQIKKWVNEHLDDARLSPEMRTQLNDYERISQKDKELLLIALLGIPEIREIMHHSANQDIYQMIASYLSKTETREVAKTSHMMHSLFSNPKEEFLETVALGNQEKAERFLNQVLLGQDEKIQLALLHQGPFVDHAGRKFNCSAYEYAYWAKDTYMCRMLERYMDETTKAQMVERISQIEQRGLTYIHHDKTHQSTHFDLEPLKKALRNYLTINVDDAEQRYTGLLAVGNELINLPAHVAQEYLSRPFSPCPTFREPVARNLTYIDPVFEPNRNWYSLMFLESPALLALSIAGRSGGNTLESMRHAMSNTWAETDLTAITLLDEVRSQELVELQAGLNPSSRAASQDKRIEKAIIGIN